jgi:hypothetical protein
MIDLRHGNGNRHSFPYAHLLWGELDPSIGITLHFSTHTVELTGVNLEPLYNAILGHACGVIQATSERHASKDKDETVVHRITVTLT